MNQAILEALEKLSRGVEPVIVREDDGSYEAYPAAYMTDASYTGSRDVVANISENGFGPEFDLEDEESWDDYAKWMADQIESEL